MALDPNIPLQYRPPQFGNQLVDYANVMQIQQAGNQNRLAEIQYRQAMQAEADNQALRGMPNGSKLADRVNKLNDLGRYKEAAELETNALATKKTQGEISKQDRDAAIDHLEILGGSLAPISRNPTREAVMRTVAGLATQGIKPPPNMPVPDDDALLPQWTQQVMAATKQGLEALKAYQPKVDMTNLGATVQPMNTNALAGPVGALAGAAPIAISATPGEVMTNQRGLESNATARGNLAVAQANLGVSRDRLANDKAARLTGKWTNDLDRGLQINSETGETRPITAGGAQIAPKEKALTESQGKGQLYGTRAAESDKILNSLEDKISLTGLAAGSSLGIAGNTMLSENQQKVLQAQRNFVNAVLRQESGAVISDAEFANAQKQYFAQPGDAKSVIEQKRANRQSAIEGFTVMAGPAGKRIDAVRDKKSGRTSTGKVGGVLTQNPDGSFNYGR